MPRVIFCPVEEAGILAQSEAMSTVKKNGKRKITRRMSPTMKENALQSS
jgi:hypothetical protein